MRTTTLAKWEGRIRPLLGMLTPTKAVELYSRGRLDFLKRMKNEVADETYSPPKSLARILWGLKFQGPLMNAAGMYKNGECFDLVQAQGAAGFLGGTGVWNARKGNEKEGVYLPFVPYSLSHAASNFLGLPQDGDKANSERTQPIKKRSRIPIGWSVMGSPDLQGEEKLIHLVHGMKLYERAGVDFLEINESCPNTQHGRPQDDDLAKRLKYIKENFIESLQRSLPVAVKFSTDTQITQIPTLLDLLFSLGYSGVNFGNTSTAYTTRREKIDPRERDLYDFFTTTFGGGVSGRPLRESSLELCTTASAYLKSCPPAQEFHIIRTGGIESAQDLIESDKAGVSINQWFTGYWEAFARHGHDLYKKVHEEYTQLKRAT